MRYWLRGKRGGCLAFAAITALVAGGLGWATTAALRLEAEQVEAQVRAEEDRQLRLAMWKLEARVAPALALEDNRPYNHYSAIYATPRALVRQGAEWRPDTVLEPSPLLGVELPDWILLHFQVDQGAKWSSPQVLLPTLRKHLEDTGIDVSLANVTPRRERLLAELKDHLQPAVLLAQVQEHGDQPALLDNTVELSNFAGNNSDVQSQLNQVPAQQTKDAGGYQSRAANTVRVQSEGKLKGEREDRSLAGRNFPRNGEDWFARGLPRPAVGDAVPVSRGPLARLWLTTADDHERLVAARLVTVGERQVCQGIVFDWDRLQQVLAEEIADLFPEARFEAMHARNPPHPERTMINLPVELIPGSVPLLETVEPGWTPLRSGLATAWATALIALAVVGLGGWALYDLSERRIRFVSAVTHELRTPLTTLRLYLDMLTGGMVREERQKEEYLHTLNAQAERLSRLIANVLDFSRLENQRPRLTHTKVKLGALLEQMRATWLVRCHDAGKELILEDLTGAETFLETDAELLQQILGNLIDNACKYSQGALDQRIWLRARQADGRLLLEVEDRGPGVAPRERRTIFRPFRRGRSVDVTAGGVGLGLALAHRWTRLLGGRLFLGPKNEPTGACFQLELSSSTTPAGETHTDPKR
jgi:signal transduction histidine kinase